MIDVESKEFLTRWDEMLKEGREKIIKDQKLEGEELEVEYEKLVLTMWGLIGKRDLGFLLTQVLGWKGLSKEFHGELCDFLMKNGELKLALAPRGHLKSTIITFGYVLWRIVCNPEIRILITNYKGENAKAFLHQIRGEIQMNERFQLFYGYLIPDFKKVKWNESALTMRRNTNPKEATIETTGVGAEITSRHYDLIIFDDVVGPENIGTLEQIQKLRTWYNQMISILEPGGDQIIVGTRWHFADLYGFLIDNLGSVLHVFHRKVLKDDGTPLWPEKFTLARINSIHERMSADPKQGEAMFQAQYNNVVIDEKTASFKRGKLKKCKMADVPHDLALSICLDPAIGQKQDADRAAITVRAVDPNNHWWVLAVWAKRGVPPTESVDKLFEIFEYFSKRFFVGGVGVETQAFQKALSFSINDKIQEGGIPLPLVELGNWQQSKELRIKGLVPRYDNGLMHFVTDGPDFDSDKETGIEILFDEMFRFPKAQHDDTLDSLAMHQEIPLVASPGIGPMDQEQPEEESMGPERYGYKNDSSEARVPNFI